MSTYLTIWFYTVKDLVDGLSEHTFEFPILPLEVVCILYRHFFVVLESRQTLEFILFHGTH
jgi:hypothetical protein